MDNLAQLMNAVFEAEKQAAAYKNGQLRVGAAIEALKQCDPEASIYFDFCDFRPTELHGDRGYYSDLAFSYEQYADTKVGPVLEWLEKSIGANFEGYKGGDNYMHADTPLWVANYGKSHNTAIVGVTKGKYNGVYFITKIIE